MKPYKTVRDCWDALERDMIVDQKDNAVPPSVVEALRRKIDRTSAAVMEHIRYEGHDAISYFTPTGNLR